MGLLATPLDSALGSRSKVRLLRLLVEQDRIVSAREAARLTGGTNPAMLAAIDELAKMGLIHREISGRQFLCRANRDHRLFEAVRQLFSDEAQWTGMFFGAIRTGLAACQPTGDGSVARGRPLVVAAWLFGSVATGRDRPGSDVDLFVLSRTNAAVQPILEGVAEHVTRWQKEFGADVRPVVMSREQVITQLRGGSTFLRQAVRSARVIVGEIPKEFRIGKTDDDTKG